MATAMHADFTASIGSKPFSYEMAFSDENSVRTAFVNNLIDNKQNRGIKIQFGNSNPDPATLLCFGFNSANGDGVYGVAVRSASSMSIIARSLRATNPYFVRSVPYLEAADMQLEGKAWAVIDYTPKASDHVPNDIGLDLAFYTQSGTQMERETHHLDQITESIGLCLFDEIALTPAEHVNTSTLCVHTFGGKRLGGAVSMGIILQKFDLSADGVFDTQSGGPCEGFFPLWLKPLFQDLAVCLLGEILRHNVHEEINSLLT
jgi:hypothetical protein